MVSRCVRTADADAVDTEVNAARSKALLLDRSVFRPATLEQPSDRGWVRWKDREARVTRVEGNQGRGMWHILDGPRAPGRRVRAVVNPGFRFMMNQLHTDLHILNALVHREFRGSAVIGVQMNENGTAHIDFHMAEIDNLKLRSLQGEVNTIIARGLQIRECRVSREEAERQPELYRGRAITPPLLPDGTLRVIEIAGLDRQACGGTHLENTAQSPPIRIVKIRNMGRRRRRVYVGIQDL